jgi:hypothetical protein
MAVSGLHVLAIELCPRMCRKDAGRGVDLRMTMGKDCRAIMPACGSRASYHISKARRSNQRLHNVHLQ